ncbi:MAG: ubiquinone/menaquinone biosynthesis methyltransferase [Gemmatimonadaceae bacterium]|nr:ubiquinone/menaquinone biosynthesis methyltransferase [Gemmatimonadaceae bacterium]
MAALDALDVDAVVADPTRKQRFVTPMFDVIAPRYDAFTRLFSFGMDRSWKAVLLERLEAVVPSQARVLDVACGTGDLAAALSSGRGTRRVLGIDASSEMVRAARRRHGTGGAAFVVGDVMALPMASASVDAVTAGYAIRNAPTIDGAVRELARVVAPGGWLGVLDFYRPVSTVWRWLFLGYLRVAGDVVGWWWHRRPVVYGYIARSIAGFTTVDGFSDALERAGFEVVETRRYLLGGIALHVARRRADD